MPNRPPTRRATPRTLSPSRYVVDLIQNGLTARLALNGAGITHDFELAALGSTGEAAAKSIRSG